MTETPPLASPVDTAAQATVPEAAPEMLNLRVWAITGRFVDIRTPGPWQTAVALFKSYGMIMAEKGCIPWESIGYIEILPKEAAGVVLSIVPGTEPK